MLLYNKVKRLKLPLILLALLSTVVSCEKETTPLQSIVLTEKVKSDYCFSENPCYCHFLSIDL